MVFTIIALCMLTAPVFSSRLRVPDLVLLLGMGALLGPNALNIIERNTAITLLGAVGLVYIMFLAGLEIDLHRFRFSYKRSLFFGVLTFAIPQILGALAGFYILGMNWSASILLASMFASHTLLAYPLASRLGIARSEPVAITVGATIITDTMALLVLAIIADSTRGMALNLSFWATVIIGMITMTVLIWKGIPIVSRWFFQRVTEESNAQFLFVIVMVCGCAYLSHFARMEPIIGAFLAGAAFNRLIPENSPLMSRVTFAGNTLFIPFFLISVGMLVDPQSMMTGTRSWLVGATMVVMVVVTKYLAVQITRRLFNYSQAAGSVMFGLSVVQAAATLAAVVVGHDLGIFDEAVLNGAIIMILLTCPLGAWAVNRYGRRMVAETPPISTTTSNEQRLMVSVSKPESAIKLLDLAFYLRNPKRQGGVFPLTIALDQNNTEEVVAQGEKLLAFCMAHAASADTSVTPGLRVAVNVADGIVRATREMRPNTVICGWSRKLMASIRIFGTTIQHLTETCPSRLLFCRSPKPLNTINRILVPFPPLASRLRDLPELARDIKKLAQQIGAELKIYVFENEKTSLEKLLQETKPSCKLTSTVSVTRAEMQQLLFSEIKKNDLILLPVDRRNGIIWTPALDRLPEAVVKRFPENNILVAYPSLPDIDTTTSDSTSAEQNDEFPDILPAELNRQNTLEEAIHRMTNEAFSDQPETAEEAFANLMSSMQTYPVELAPGIVLLHTRCGNLPHSQLLVCHHSESRTLPELPQPVKIFLVLLNSQSKPPEYHLKILSLVASRMLKVGKVTEFKSISSAAELCNLLKNGITPPADNTN